MGKKVRLTPKKVIQKWIWPKVSGYVRPKIFDQTNPLTQTVHGRKVSCLGPGGLTGRTASFRSRDIHPSHYGRICPIDTSEGTTAGCDSKSRTRMSGLRFQGVDSASSPRYPAGSLIGGKSGQKEETFALSPSSSSRDKSF